MPNYISKLRFLQTLDASRSFCISQTIDLRKLTSLRHVIGKFVGKLLIGDTVNLQTLRSISSDSLSKLKHELLINLRDLEIYDQFMSVKRRVPVSWASLTKLRNLRVLKLEANDIYLSLESEEAVRSMDVISPSLESVTFVGINLKEDPMPFLQKMPRLEDLMLQDCDYSGEKMSISEQGFGRLRKLQLFMERLDELQIEEEAMPNLIQLRLSSILRLQTKLIIPKRLRACMSYETPERLRACMNYET
ncbi:hypothetical protein ISN44_As10g014380 [Arabidopsis suecica]|uniref:Disease resistance R13L4/SHOC-2-like LRR domain-containing protein n=1 Tax=Arabidopsis suecica TaxID=45249 RepID=A0A8T1ZWU0_ARASU|nr:hypothetical protein ISN44_As10g014380 [Arabidopsis suecica]